MRLGLPASYINGDPLPGTRGARLGAALLDSISTEVLGFSTY